MNINFYHRFCLTLIAITIDISLTQAQTSSEFWITVQSDSNAMVGGPERLLFGNHINATYGIDSLNPELIERIMPPTETWLIAIWKNIPGRVNSWGDGLLNFDFRSIPTNILRVDTFKIFFVDWVNYNSDITIRWPRVDYLSHRCDSMFLVDPTCQIPRIDAFSVDSIVIIDAYEHSIFNLLIYKYGCKIIDDAESKSNLIPENYSLHQNYPNPFNPTTSIKYQLPFNSRVKLKIYNVLGQQVALLANEIQQAGAKSANWNAGDQASGVYFYKLEAVSVSDPGKKMLLVK
jgi:hypothetical protein